jgi:hypothetical protein
MYFDAEQTMQALEQTERHREPDLLGDAVVFALGWLLGGWLRKRQQ